jgi:hypothetical protein
MQVERFRRPWNSAQPDETPLCRRLRTEPFCDRNSAISTYERFTFAQITLAMLRRNLGAWRTASSFAPLAPPELCSIAQLIPKASQDLAHERRLPTILSSFCGRRSSYLPPHSLEMLEVAAWTLHAACQSGMHCLLSYLSRSVSKCTGAGW